MKKTRYISPDFKAVIINVSRIVCQSPGNDGPDGSVSLEGYSEKMLDW